MRLPALVALFGCFALACHEPSANQPQPNEPSPNASILPAPLASELESSPTKIALPDAGRVLDGGSDAGAALPRTLREDAAPERDLPQRDIAGVRLRAELRWLDLPPFPRPPEANVEALQRLRDALSFAMVIELSVGGRLRVVFDSDAFVVPSGTELRARDDYYGHLLVFNAGQSYASVAPGTLRALLTEHRADAAPITKPKIAEVGAGHVLGVATLKRELVTPLGRLVMEQGNVAQAGAGARLLCRMLAEFIAADPRNAVCSRRDLPLRAELFSSGGGHLAFEVTKLERDPELDATALLAPPAEASFAAGELPGHVSPIVPRPERLRELRTRAAARTEKPDASAPKHGLLIQNRSENLRYVLLDGVVLARILPRRELHVEGLLPGKYALASLDFLGDDATPLRTVELPARVALGEIAETER